jgi:hypothetical protein
MCSDFTRAVISKEKCVAVCWKDYDFTINPGGNKRKSVETGRKRHSFQVNFTNGMKITLLEIALIFAYPLARHEFWGTYKPILFGLSEAQPSQAWLPHVS